MGSVPSGEEKREAQEKGDGSPDWRELIQRALTLSIQLLEHGSRARPGPHSKAVFCYQKEAVKSDKPCLYVRLVA